MKAAWYERNGAARDVLTVGDMETPEPGPGEVRVKTGLTRFLPARLLDGKVEAVTWQGSGDLASTSRSNCFLVVPSDQQVLVAGETVSILL